jgi:uncharacterized membrane protein
MPTLENFINKYYLEPLWNHEGYNVVNTVTYAIIAIAAAYLLYRFLKTRVGFDKNFTRGVLSFVLLGSTARVVTDALDTGVFKPVTPFHALVLSSHIWDYPTPTSGILNYFTITPGIYVAVAALFLISLGALYKLKRLDLLWIVGLALWLPFFLLLLPFMKFAIYAVPIILLAAVPAYLAFRYFKDSALAGIVAGHSLDGAATFFVIDVFSKISGIPYGEQHVFASEIGAIGGTYFPFYIIKVLVSFAAAYVIMREDMPNEDKLYIAILLMVMGFAPGIRDMLRMACGA